MKPPVLDGVDPGPKFNEIVDFVATLVSAPDVRITVLLDDLPQASARLDLVRLADGKTLVAAATAEQPTRLWNVSDPRHPAELTALRGHDGEVNTVAFSQTAPLLVTGGEDGQVITWDTRDSRPQVIAKLGSPVSGLTLSRDGRTLALADETHSLWLCAVDGTQIGAPASFPGPDALVRGMAFTREGTRLAVGANDGVIRFMDVASRQELSRLTQPNRVRALAFSEDDSVLASASSAGRSYLWHLPVSNRAGHDSPLQTVSRRRGLWPRRHHGPAGRARAALADGLVGAGADVDAVRSRTKSSSVSSPVRIRSTTTVCGAAVPDCSPRDAGG